MDRVRGRGLGRPTERLPTTLTEERGNELRTPKALRALPERPG